MENNENNNLAQIQMDSYTKLKTLRQAIAKINPEDQEIAKIDKMIEKLRTRQYTVAVVGEFNRGKSSLINSLLGMNILPADITPTTATINRVVYSEAPYSRLKMINGEIEEIPLLALKARVTKITEEARSASEQVEEAVIGYPTVFCRNNISILDTPGLNESEAMDKCTFDRMNQIDALIFTLRVDYPFSYTEAKVVCKLLSYENIRHILFTVGFMDKVPEDEAERTISAVRKRIVKLTANVIDNDVSLTEEEAERRKTMMRDTDVLGVSAKDALDSFVNGNVDQLRRSRIEDYKKTLMMRLTAQQDEWISADILPYLQNNEIFDRAVLRNLLPLQNTISAVDECIRELDEYISVLSPKIQDAGSQWKNNISELDNIYTYRFDMTLNMQSFVKSHKLRSDYKDDKSIGNGVIGMALQAAALWGKNKGIFRTDNDSETVYLKEAFEHAKNDAIVLMRKIREQALQSFPEYKKAIEDADHKVTAIIKRGMGFFHLYDSEELNIILEEAKKKEDDFSFLNSLKSFQGEDENSFNNTLASEIAHDPDLKDAAILRESMLESQIQETVDLFTNEDYEKMSSREIGFYKLLSIESVCEREANNIIDDIKKLAESRISAINILFSGHAETIKQQALRYLYILSIASVKHKEEYEKLQKHINNIKTFTLNQ